MEDEGTDMGAGGEISKLLQAAMGLLQSAPNAELQVTNLNKALFYLDLITLRDTGNTLTGATYLALDQGPVVAKYQQKLVNRLVSAGLAEQREDGMSKPVRVVKPLKLEECFSPADIERINDLSKAVSKRTAAWLSEMSHGNTGWQIAHQNGRQVGNGAAVPINMLIALQQLPHDDKEWLDAPLTESETSVVNERRLADAKPW